MRRVKPDYVETVRPQRPISDPTSSGESPLGRLDCTGFVLSSSNVNGPSGKGEGNTEDIFVKKYDAADHHPPFYDDENY
jgi:hypothetical protein